MKNLPVKVAAKLMGRSPTFIGKGLQQKALPFGSAVKWSGRWQYYISPIKFEEFTGIDLDSEVKENELS